MPPKRNKRSDDKDQEDRAEGANKREKTMGALKALQKRGISKDPPAISKNRSTKNSNRPTVIDTGSPLTTATPAQTTPAVTPSALTPIMEDEPGVHFDEGGNFNNDDDLEKDDNGSDEGFISNTEKKPEVILVQLDLLDLDNPNKVHESVMAMIDDTIIGPGKTIHIQELLLKTEAVPPMTGMETSSCYCQSWPQQANQSQPRQDTPFSINPRDEFNQSKLGTEVLDWLAIELDAPEKALPGAATLWDAWEREKMFRQVKSNADAQFRHKQAYRINKGPHTGMLFRVDALQDICFLKHTSCSNSTTGFANAEKDPKMARWLAGKPEKGDINFSSWSITKFWTEAKERLSEAARKPATLHGKDSNSEKMLRQAAKEKKRKAKSHKRSNNQKQHAQKKPGATIQSSDEEESDEAYESLHSDDLDKPQGSYKPARR
ncbi:hypothetical protein FRC01_004013 [Tulasnella sp. 417]|nr:hypothetical protein FRC01_004013 [Tulasnella sp. 417]